MPSPPSERRIVHYSGRVQGVGFRFTARQAAEEHGVVGFVENLPDGRVRLVAEGSPERLDQFLAALSRRMDRYIRGSEVESGLATGEFDDFSIRR
jgi:acylphosphatase